MSHATSGMPARRSPRLAARHHRPARTVRALRPPGPVPVPGQGRALPQGLRRDLDHHPRPRRAADRARLIRAYTPGRGEPR